MSGMITPNSKRPSFLDGLIMQHSVLRALILREIQARFGRDNVGYLWFIFEPLLLASVIASLHFFVPGSIHTPGMGPFPFTLLGYCLFMVFRNSFNRADGALEQIGSLMYHSQITPIDFMIARNFVDVIGAVSAWVLLLTVGIMLGIADFPARPIYVFIAIFELAIWTFGLSLLVATYSLHSHVLGRLVHPISYFMLPISGAFITMSFLPRWARDYMSWNPMFSMFETARYGQFLHADDRYIFPGYIAAHCLASLYFGLASIRDARKQIIVK